MNLHGLENPLNHSHPSTCTNLVCSFLFSSIRWKWSAMWRSLLNFSALRPCGNVFEQQLYILLLKMLAKHIHGNCRNVFHSLSLTADWNDCRSRTPSPTGTLFFLPACTSQHPHILVFSFSLTAPSKLYWALYPISTPTSLRLCDLHCTWGCVVWSQFWQQRHARLMLLQNVMILSNCYG